MKAIVMDSFGGPESLRLGETPDVTPGPGELLVRVRATALNRADLLQRRGLYPPPPGESTILGLEMAGEVAAAGADCRAFKPGDRVCALLPGGGYAEYAVIPEGMAMRLPESLSMEQGAAIPEVFLTAYMNLFWLGSLKPGETALIHAGASGVGTAAIQLIREADAASFVTAGSQQKLERCFALGAAAGFNYNDGDFAPWVKEQTDGKGVSLIFDFIGAPYFASNLESLAVGGRLVIIGTMGGAKVDGLNLSMLLSRRLQIIGTALRTRSRSDKIELTRQFAEFALPRFEDGRLVPVIDSVFPWEEAAAAHAYMETNRNVGKIVLKVAP